MTRSWIFCRMSFVLVHDGTQQSTKTEDKLDRLIHLTFTVLEFMTGTCNTGHGSDQNSGFITAPDCRSQTILTFNKWLRKPYLPYLSHGTFQKVHTFAPKEIQTYKHLTSVNIWKELGFSTVVMKTYLKAPESCKHLMNLASDSDILLWSHPIVS